MYMDEYEIEYSYTHAANSNNQITVLADLNLAGRMEICELLYRRGVLDTSAGYGLCYIISVFIRRGLSDKNIRKRFKVKQGLINKVRKHYMHEDMGERQVITMPAVNMEIEEAFKQIEVLQKQSL